MHEKETYTCVGGSRRYLYVSVRPESGSPNRVPRIRKMQITNKPSSPVSVHQMIQLLKYQRLTKDSDFSSKSQSYPVTAESRFRDDDPLHFKDNIIIIISTIIVDYKLLVDFIRLETRFTKCN